MTDSIPSQPDSALETAHSEANASGGVNLESQRDVTIGGDVVLGDKIINVAPGAVTLKQNK